MDGQNTGEIGGLYPGGSNVRPPEHEAMRLIMASQIVPLDAMGNPDPVNGKIALVSIGMSNTYMEFKTFIQQANDNPDINPQLILVNGAHPGWTADKWVDPDADAWRYVYQLLRDRGLTPAQVQVAWMKQTHVRTGSFPEWPLKLEQNLELISRNLKTNFPNIKIAYYSSRTRSYNIGRGLNPEPSAYESGFSVRWLIEKQINGDPSLNFDPNKGEVVAPYLSWGPYLWIDGENARSDGQVWLQEDMVRDCTHPTMSGTVKVAAMLLDFFKSDTTTVGWFLNAFSPEPGDTSLPSETPVTTQPATPMVTLGAPERVATGTATIPRLTPKPYVAVMLEALDSPEGAGILSLGLVAVIGVVVAFLLKSIKR
jgi:hypothetical protein